MTKSTPFGSMDAILKNTTNGHHNYAFCNPLFFIDPNGKDGIPYITKYEYAGNGWDYAKAIPNAFTNVVNGGIAVINSAIATVETISNEGFDGYVSALGQ